MQKVDTAPRLQDATSYDVVLLFAAPLMGANLSTVSSVSRLMSTTASTQMESSTTTQRLR